MPEIIPITEAEFVGRITHLRCGWCDQIHMVDDVDELDDIDGARDLVPQCGCDDPIGYPLIVTQEAMFGVDEIDADYEIPGQQVWHYDVSSDLFDSLVEAGAAR